MGNGQSLFYPDNGNRYNRAQQLGNDCENYKHQFESQKADLERILGPYQAKINRVMKAFGCNDLDDLSRLVERTGTGEALAQWNRVKNVYNKTEMVDQVIYGAMGVVAISGLTISAIGSLTGGIGFAAGIAVTGKILLVLGVVGLIVDAIAGAINRAKLREAINSLFESRLKIKRIANHLDNLHLWMPMIHQVYQVFEDAGYTEERIIKKLKEKKFDEPIREDMKEQNYYNIARSLRDLDESRRSWVNEDPDWKALALTLQNLETVASGLAVQSATALQARNLLPQTQNDISATSINFALPAYVLEIYSPHPTDESPLPYNAVVSVNMKPKAGGAGSPSLSPIFSSPLKFQLDNLLDDKSASVTIRTSDEKYILGIDGSRSLLTETPLQPAWVITFASTDIDKYKTLWPTPETTTEVFLVSPPSNQYLVADGSLTEKESLAAKFMLSYSDSQLISLPAFPA